MTGLPKYAYTNTHAHGLAIHIDTHTYAYTNTHAHGLAIHTDTDTYAYTYIHTLFCYTYIYR